MSLLKNRNFLLLRAGWSISNLGTQLQVFVFSLYILKLTGSAMQFALMLCLQIVPSILMAPFGGYVADRYDRRRQVVLFDGLSAGVAFAFFGLNEAWGRLPAAGAYACVVLLAGLQQFTSSASSGLMQAAVPARDVTAQQSVGSMLNNLNTVAAPALGGLMFGLFGLSAALLCNAVSFVACAVLESRVRLPAQTPPAGAYTGVRGFFAAQREAAAYIRGSRFLQSFLFVVVALNFILSSTDVGMMLVLQKLFALGPTALGAASAAVAFGVVAGAALAGLLGRQMERIGLNRLLFLVTLLVAAAFAAVGALLFAGVGRMPAAACLGLFLAFHALIAACCGLISVHISSTFQKSVDPAVIGRTSALSGAVSVCAAPLGQVAAGAMLSALPYGAMYLAEGVFSGVTLLFMKRMGRGQAESAIIKKKTRPADAPAAKGTAG